MYTKSEAGRGFNTAWLEPQVSIIDTKGVRVKTKTKFIPSLVTNADGENTRYRRLAFALAKPLIALVIMLAVFYGITRTAPNKKTGDINAASSNFSKEPVQDNPD